ncbi:MAG: GTP cyclohydrolase I FolE [Legionellales bacterium]|nr:GTP cyclohydrolase I FolE [Legionellales bacterium]
MEQQFKQIIQALGEDIDREGLRNTPKRAAEALQYFTQGYQQSLDEIVKDALFQCDADEMIIVKDIELYSLCEHHLVPFIGKCHVGYIPVDGKILGLSKIARIVELFARRLQVQERLTRQVANSILETTRAEGVGIIIEAQHLCMMMRGVEKQNSVMTTSAMLGSFRTEASVRAEFLNLIR